VPENYSTPEFLLILIFSNYLFKMVAAMIDTIPFYIGVRFLSGYLNMDPNKEYRSKNE
jgi:uncharacterized PurR-regulated membrane protein YhhQ (DUF165 family)